MPDGPHDRTDLKDFFGATNTVSGADFFAQVVDTCAQIYAILMDHCGPLATDALIIQDNAGRNLKDRHYAIFTKDGINIVRSIEFHNPIQQHIQNLVAYIGTRVDDLSHDGTTTSMMFFTHLLEECFRHRVINDSAPERRLMGDGMRHTLRLLSGHIDDAVITVDRLKTDFKISHLDAIRYIAYHQAMISSKGDRELTSAIVDVVETLPKELYGLFTVEQSNFERDRRFTVLTDDFNFVLPVVSNLDDMNHKLGTEYRAEICDLVVCEDDLIAPNPALHIILDLLQQAEIVPRTKDLVILAKSLDANLMHRILTYNRTHAVKVVVFTMSLPNRYSSRCTILMALLNVASRYPIDEHVTDRSKPFLIENAQLHYKTNRRLYISNLYAKDGSQYHPSFTNPARFKPYTRFITEIRQHLEEYVSGRLRIETALDKFRYEDYVEIYRRMMCAEVRHMQISGMTHEVLADRDVLQDAFGAVLSSLEHGFVLDGYLKLALAMQHSDNMSLPRKILCDTIDAIIGAVHHQKTDEVGSIVKDAYLKFKTQDPTYLFYPVGYELQHLDHIDLCVRIETEWVIDHHQGPTRAQNDNPKIQVLGHDAAASATQLATYNPDTTVPILMQPADAYREMFKRVEDLMPKLLNTHRVLIPNTINLRSEVGA